MNREEAYVKLDKVSKIYKMGEVEIRAVDEISFEIAKGEFVVIVGPSGAGKTTVLNILGGMDTASRGLVQVDGRNITDYNSRQLTAYRRDDIGFVFQFYNLVPNLTAKENVELATQISKDSLNPAEVLKEVGLGDRLDNFPAQLSGGQAQRVALARALAASPDILLLDEPFSGLDENLRDDMRSLLLRLVREERLTTVMVTHDAHEALRMSDVIVALEDGKVTQAAKPQELYRSPATAAVAACFGDCSTLTGAVVDGVFRVADVAVPIARVGGTFQTGRSGAAEAVVRTVGCSIGVPGGKPPVADAIAVGTARVRCSAFAGARWVARLDVDGQTLSAFLSEACEAGVDAPVSLDPAETFIYPVD